jgi:hypothetical protein
MTLHQQQGAGMLATMSKEPGKRGRPKRGGVPLHVIIPPHIKAEFDRLADENRRPLTTEILIALEERLDRLGRSTQAPEPEPEAEEKPKRKEK